jgi:phage shock protein PspC (stress-responsive transcriptional regulator)
MEKKLYRDDMHKKIGGVCAGLAEHFSIDVTIVRLVFLLTLIFHGGGLPIYIILWIVLPKRPYPLQNPFADYAVPFGTEAPLKDPAFFNQPKSKSTGTIIAGAVLVLVGTIFIMDNLNIIPDWDMEHLWPLILIAVGIIIIFSGTKKQPWEADGWNKQDNTGNNIPPTV